MLTDLQLQQNTMAELRWEPSVKAACIGVAAKDGVVTLTGELETYAQKFAAERAIDGVGDEIIRRFIGETTDVS